MVENNNDTIDDNDAEETPPESNAESLTDTPEGGSDTQDTFPREYVEQLRDENAKYRQKAGRADELAERLHGALVAATGKLQDPSDLPFDDTHLDDPDALVEAVEKLIENKPHLKSRAVTGDIGQGMSASPDNVNLAGLLRASAN